MRFVQCLAATLVLLVAPWPATAAGDGRVDVTISHTGTDGLGKRLAASLATELGASRRLKLVKESHERIGLYLATMHHEGTTIYSATWTFGGIADDGYLTSKVGACDADAIRACVRRLLAETDKHAGVLAAVKATQGGAR
ncbi:hypothetical protein RAMLITH_12600 [Ramlibacter sp. RBP-2]|uniref:Uncharacterized protein n=1 Tax=Ramlibacter lithotrophicus TaxID=2606681 RepID=A0A7X6DGC6_9BURK|nr:hypothetical protein [Ramlibacter lithotrophicus]NKE66665.1 hypothetical protein [Ramlibacter lithotrophicus]